MTSTAEDRRFGLDDNNNAAKYSLRPRAAPRRCGSPQKSTVVAEAAEERPQKPKRSRRDKQHPPLSKYRRKTANARERSRMREINEAFEALRRAVPRVQEESGEKATKISTLKLAMEYITSLHRALGDSEEGSRERTYPLALGDAEGDLQERSFHRALGDTEEDLRERSYHRALGDTGGSLLPPASGKDPCRTSQGCLALPDLSLSLPTTPETTDQSSSASDVSDLLLISLDLDPGPLRAFAALDQCLDDVLFADGLS